MKLLLVCSQGGHFATMQGLQKFWSAHEREWVTHRFGDTESIAQREKVHFVPRQPSRSVLMTVLNFFRAFPILFRSRPDLIISTGSAIGVSFIVAGKLLGIRSIFVESISRVHGPGLTGRLVYPLVSEFYVQWEDSIRDYPKAQYRGSVF